MTASPKTLAEKTAQYQNDSFSIWLEKTNITAREEGNLNKLLPSILNALNTQLTGTASASASDLQTIAGVGTKFISELSKGDVIKFLDNSERVVTDVVNDTSFKINFPLSDAISNQVVHNISVLNLVNAINFTYDTTMKEVRNVLIKAIAMS